MRLPGSVGIFLASYLLVMLSTFSIACIDYVHTHGEVKETFGNENHKGNGVYEVVRQWAEQKKLV